MSVWRFRVCRRDRLSNRVLERLYMSGCDETPWATQASWDGEFLVVQRSESASGNLHVPWEFPGPSERMVSTASLMERDRPYLLEVELARGTLGQTRNQLACWQYAGLVAPQHVLQRLAESSRSLARAVALQQDPSAAALHACDTLDRAVDAADRLAESYVEQALALRQRETPRLATLLGVQFGGSRVAEPVTDAIARSFNTVGISIPWRNVEKVQGNREFATADDQLQWCQRHGMKICAGPLLQFDTAGIPDWLVIWDGDFENVVSIMLDQVRSAVAHFRGRVHLWHVAARMNLGPCLSLSDQQRLEAVLQAVEATRELDPCTPIVVSLDQPWGESMIRDEMSLAPLHYADALVRSGVGLSALGLEINAGQFPGGTLPRGLLEYSRQLDRWSLFGLPLLVMMCAPGRSAARATPTKTNHVGDAGPPPVDGQESAMITLDTQRTWAADYGRLLLAKPNVQGILWNQLSDADSREFPHNGLIDSLGTAKPALDALRQIREQYLM
jgi:hypothetical protein